MIKFGHYTDKGLPNHKDNSVYTIQNGYKTNSHGYRCPEWDPMPDGKKNVVVLGCSHTFGEGLGEEEHWVAHLSKHNTQRLRYWNLALPGARKLKSYIEQNEQLGPKRQWNIHMYTYLYPLGTVLQP